jgi:hypothetical protein
VADGQDKAFPCWCILCRLFGYWRRRETNEVYLAPTTKAITRHADTLLPPPPRTLFSPSPVLLTTFRIRIDIFKSHHEFGKGIVSGVQDTGDPTIMFLIFASRCGRTGCLIGVGER